MEFIGKVFKTGSSHAVIIPQEIIRHLGISIGDSEIFEVKVQPIKSVALMMQNGRKKQNKTTF